MPIIVDYYSETNQSSGATLVASSRGQTFTGDGGVLNSAKFFLKKNGSPTGNISVLIYAHTGAFGVDGKPTGSILAISDNIDVSTIPTSNTLITFTFSGNNKIVLTSATNYCLVASNTDFLTQDLSNNIYFNIDTSSPSHSGNFIFNIGATWYGDNTADACFYVYKDDPVTATVSPFPSFKRSS